MVWMVMGLKVGSGSTSSQELKRSAMESNGSYRERKERTLPNSTKRALKWIRGQMLPSRTAIFCSDSGGNDVV